ncbi:MAG: hypothetical protein WBG50_28650 [Desulfomonilaceae bacterium]
MCDWKFQELMTKGFSLSNKWYFREWNQREFDGWIEDCKDILSCCEPEPELPWFTGPQHIEEIVMTLGETRRKISHGEIEYTGLL